MTAERLLAEHRMTPGLVYDNGSAWEVRCRCDAMFTGNSHREALDGHHAHLASVLADAERAARADAAGKWLRAAAKPFMRGGPFDSQPYSAATAAYLIGLAGDAADAERVEPHAAAVRQGDRAVAEGRAE